MAEFASLTDIGPFHEAVARLAFSQLATKPWESARFRFVEAGGSYGSSGRFLAPDGSKGSTPLPEALDEAWLRLRRAMADDEKGTWLAGELEVKSDGAYSFHFEYDQRPFEYQEDLFQPPADLSTVSPSDDDWLADFRDFPRSERYIPAWFRAIAQDHASVAEPSLSPSLVAAREAPLSWPDSLAPLAGEWGWRDIFDSASDHTIERLNCTASYVELLADEARRDDWPRGVAQLAENVFGDVYREILAPQAWGVALRLWSLLRSATTGVDPRGLETIDPSEPIGPLDSPSTEAERELLARISAAIGRIIDQQMHDRFGVWPD
jgi:hypothetical protein